MERTADSGGPRASLLAPGDDVATALHALRAGTALRLAAGSVVRDVTLQEDVPFGHKFAVRALAQGMRVRKYGEFIGRTTADVAAGAWVHDQNLVTSARPSADRERAWRDAAPPLARSPWREAPGAKWVPRMARNEYRAWREMNRAA